MSLSTPQHEGGPTAPIPVSYTAQLSPAEAARQEQAFAETFAEFVPAAEACERKGKALDAARVPFQRLMAAEPAAIERFCLSSERRLLREKWLFIRFNNRIVQEHFSKEKPRSGLILLPFCLQHTSCPHRIVWDLTNCRRCGKCAVGPTLQLAERAGLPVRVAVRGVFGPEFVRELRPELTIAVACEDELFKGILRTSGSHCFGVIGKQPEGYCRNTTLAADELGAALEHFFPQCAP
jgi:hypothetical protein